VHEITSPDTTERSPGDWKSAALNNVPVVPKIVLLLVKKAPPTVAVASILNTALLEVFVTTEGLAFVDAAKVAAGLVASL
jgi:hypothetical protein